MGKRTRPRDRTKERFWRRAIKRRERSGLSVRAFCEQGGLAESAFYFWRREVQKRNAENAAGQTTAKSSRTKKPRGSKRSTRPTFAAVTVADPRHPDTVHPIEIVVRDSLRVHVTRGFDAPTLREVLAVLEKRPC